MDQLESVEFGADQWLVSLNDHFFNRPAGVERILLTMHTFPLLFVAVVAVGATQRKYATLNDGEGGAIRKIDLDPLARLTKRLEATPATEMTDEMWLWWELIVEIDDSRRLLAGGRCLQAIEERPAFMRRWMGQVLRGPGRAPIPQLAQYFFEILFVHCGCDTLIDWLDAETTAIISQPIPDGPLSRFEESFRTKIAFVQTIVTAWRVGHIAPAADMEDWQRQFTMNRGDLGPFGERVGNAREVQAQLLAGEHVVGASLAALLEADYAAHLPAALQLMHNGCLQETEALDIIAQHDPVAFVEFLTSELAQSQRHSFPVAQYDWSLLHPAIVDATGPGAACLLPIDAAIRSHPAAAIRAQRDANGSFEPATWRKLAMQVCFGEFHESADADADEHALGTFVKLPPDSPLLPCLLAQLHNLYSLLPQARLDILLLARLALHPSMPTDPSSLRPPNPPHGGSPFFNAQRHREQLLAWLAQACRDNSAVDAFYRNIMLVPEEILSAPAVAGNGGAPPPALPNELIDRESSPFYSVVEPPPTPSASSTAAPHKPSSNHALLILILIIAICILVFSVGVAFWLRQKNRKLAAPQK